MRSLSGAGEIARWLVALLVITAAGVVLARFVDIGVGVGFAAAAGAFAGQSGWWL